MGAGIKLAGNIMNGKALQSLGPGAMFGLGLNAYFGVSTYKESREQGGGVLGSAAKAVGEGIMADVVGMPVYLGTMAAMELPKVGVKAWTAVNQQARSMTYQNRNVPFQNAVFNDTPQAYTMRQAGMQLAKASKYNLQQTMMGNEAQFMHKL